MNGGLRISPAMSVRVGKRVRVLPAVERSSSEMNTVSSTQTKGDDGNDKDRSHKEGYEAKSADPDLGG